MTEKEEEAVVIFKDAYLLTLMHIGGITPDGRGFPLTIERKRLEIDVGAIAQEETTLEQVLPKVFPFVQQCFDVIDNKSLLENHEWTRMNTKF